jgi:hypothetical protein
MSPRNNISIDRQDLHVCTFAYRLRLDGSVIAGSIPARRTKERKPIMMTKKELAEMERLREIGDPRAYLYIPEYFRHCEEERKEYDRRCCTTCGCNPCDCG